MYLVTLDEKLSFTKYMGDNNYSQTGKTVNTRNISGMLIALQKKPIRREKTELQARTLTSLWVCG